MLTLMYKNLSIPSVFFMKAKMEDIIDNQHHHFLGSNGVISWEGEGPLPADTFDGVLKYLNQMLMEEDLDHRPCMYQDILALQAAEKSFHDALTGVDLSIKNKKKKKNGRRREEEEYEEDEEEENRSSKQVATFFEFPNDEFDNLFLFSSTCDLNPGRGISHKIDHSQEPKRGRPRADAKKFNLQNAVDLRSLLTQCAQFVADYDNRRAAELLSQIRQHSSPTGDSAQRLAHYFANAIEARVSGMGTEMYAQTSRKRVSAADILKAYKAYILGCPFERMSHIIYGKSIMDLTEKSKKIHIIDFGILYGFHWPCLIQGLSQRDSGLEKLHITGIEFPSPGLRPGEGTEQTGQRLARCCAKFNVPFEYHAIAKKWEDITLDDLNLDKTETTIAMCLYRLRNVPDEAPSVSATNPRDSVLNLIKQINPKIFIHGVLNGTYNAPFFGTRFREALHHFSSMFDMLDGNLPRRDQDRMVYEKEVLGRDCMNVIACEGSERVERPDTYKQWRVRNLRAGFRQVPVDQNILKEIRAKIRLNYHKDFLVDEDSNWILQGWKGRVLYALSIWKP